MGCLRSGGGGNDRKDQYRPGALATRRGQQQRVGSGESVKDRSQSTDGSLWRVMVFVKSVIGVLPGPVAMRLLPGHRPAPLAPPLGKSERRQHNAGHSWRFDLSPSHADIVPGEVR